MIGTVLKVIRRKKPMDWVRFLLVWISGIVTVALLLYLVGFILVRGIPHIKPSLFAVN